MFLELNNKERNVPEIQNNGKPLYNFNGENLFSEDFSVIGEFKKINFFIGSNNSGKSRFLRALLKFDVSNSIPLISNLKYVDAIKNINRDYYHGNMHVVQMLPNYANFHSIVAPFLHKVISNEISSFDLINNFHTFRGVFEANDLFMENLNSKTSNKLAVQTLKEVSTNIKNLETLALFSRQNSSNGKVYIPTLRSSTRNSNFGSDTFNNIIKENYSLENNVFTGLKIYEELSDKKNSPGSERRKVKKFEKFLSETFFDNKEVEITANKTKPSAILVSIDEQEYPIYDIGDGIQMLIILLFPIFTSNENTWFFIEEPETHLHPGLQRIFIETLLNDDYLKSKNLRYFFTTHSNHFLDLSLQSNDISIFQFQKESQEKFNIKNVKPSKETLDLLGVNNSSVLMANASIWVEGPTDRKYISKFLKLYCEEKKHQNLKEDIDFAFFEYGGNLIHHYLFDESFDEVFTEEEVREKINAFALSNKIYLLADNDNANGKKLERRQKLEDISANQKYFQYQNTNYREIENLLPVKVIKDFLVELVNSSEIEKLSGLNFERKDYISVGLGKFIEDLFKKNKIKDFKKFKDDSGTLKSSYKTKLCEFVINGNYNYQDLIFDNELLDEIVEKLYSFVKS